MCPLWCRTKHSTRRFHWAMARSTKRRVVEILEGTRQCSDTLEVCWYLILLLQIFSLFCQWKNCENFVVFDEVNAHKIWCHFLAHLALRPRRSKRRSSRHWQMRRSFAFYVAIIGTQTTDDEPMDGLTVEIAESRRNRNAFSETLCLLPFLQAQKC